MNFILVLFDNLYAALGSFFDYVLDLLVDFHLRFLGMLDLELVFPESDVADAGHAELGHNRIRHIVHLLKVVGGPSRDLVEKHYLRTPAPQHEA